MPITERADGALIHHASHGSGFPVLLLGPTGADGATDEPGLFGTVRALDAYRVITADRRHTGGSTAPLAPFSYAEAAADQLAVLDDLGADAVHVVASGDGTALALRLAHDAPARIASLVLQAPVGLDSTNTIGSFHAPYDEAMRLARAEGLEGVVAAAVRDGRFGAEPAPAPSPSSSTTTPPSASTSTRCAASATSPPWSATATACGPTAARTSRSPRSGPAPATRRC